MVYVQLHDKTAFTTSLVHLFLFLHLVIPEAEQPKRREEEVASHERKDGSNRK